MVPPVIVTIDGPAGAGKSTVAREVSARLGFAFLDTGAMYRVSVFAAQEFGVPPYEALRRHRVDLGHRILLDDRDVTDAIRTTEISRLTHEAATDPRLRESVNERLRETIAHGNWVAEGRDMGTVVIPHAELKIFLTASDEERARRRALESGESVEHVLESIRVRDEADTTREHAPLAAADDAVVIDSSGQSFEAVVDQIVALVPSELRANPRLFSTAAADVAPPSQARRRVSRRAH